jgi:hypothetical protein
VWSREAQHPEWIEYATTRAYTYGNHAEVDAPLAIQHAAALYYAQAVIDGERRKAAAEAQMPSKGRRVVVTKGKYKGWTGTVGWIGANQFRSRAKWSDLGDNHPASLRVRVDFPEGSGVFVDMLNVRLSELPETPDYFNLHAEIKFAGRLEIVGELWHLVQQAKQDLLTEEAQSQEETPREHTYAST